MKRETLSNVLQKNGIKGKMVKMIKSIYNVVLSCVRCPYGTTILLDCPNVVKQGCILSPILFSLLVQEITNDVEVMGYNLFLTWLRLVFLLCADDIILIADSVFELRKQVILYGVAVKLGLVVDMDTLRLLFLEKEDI